MAKKSLKKMLEEYTARPEADGSAKRLATFLAYWDEIEDAYKKGWSWLQIHSALLQEGVIDYSYTTFLYYKDKKQRREMEAAKREAVIRNAEIAKTGAKPTQPARPSPTPGASKGELPTFNEVRDVKRF